MWMWSMAVGRWSFRLQLSRSFSLFGRTPRTNKRRIREIGLVLPNGITKFGKRAAENEQQNVDMNRTNNEQSNLYARKLWEPFAFLPALIFRFCFSRNNQFKVFTFSNAANDFTIVPGTIRRRRRRQCELWENYIYLTAFYDHECERVWCLSAANERKTRNYTHLIISNFSRTCFVSHCAADVELERLVLFGRALVLKWRSVNVRLSPSRVETAGVVDGRRHTISWIYVHRHLCSSVTKRTRWKMCSIAWWPP